MATIPETLAIAVQHHQAGRLEAAEQSYRQVLAADPNEANAWHLLGILNAQLGRRQAGVDCIRRALALRPDWVDALCNLGRALFEQRKPDEAAACYRRALELKPDHGQAYDNLGLALQGQGKTEEAVACHRRALQLRSDFAAAHNNLGLALQGQGKLDEAAACFRRALQLQPDFAAAHNNLGGLALQGQGNLDEAVACFRQALQLQPDFAAAHNNLGLALQRQGNLDAAVASFRQALQLQPDSVETHSNLGQALQGQGKLDEAVTCYRRALELKPNSPEAHNNLGIALKDQGNLDEALACYRRALDLKRDSAETHNNLGSVLTKQGKLTEAIACYRRALQLKPDYAHAHTNLGNALNLLGKPDDAVACHRRALELMPDCVGAHSNLLHVLHYRGSLTLKELAEAHAEFEHKHCAGLRPAWPQHENVRERPPSVGSSRRLRVGFVSSDFGRHPVGFFLIRALENLDRGQCETVCYSDRIVKDDLTTRFQAAATVWREAIGLNHEQLAAQIRADRIDILFDLAGHTAGNRLLVFARKPAPIQITWIGYEGTTGLEAMDYILADRYTIPAGVDAGYREQVLQMPHGYVCYDPPTTSPQPGPLPAAKNGYLRFGSFNNLAKINPQVVEVWAKVLQRVPQSRLALKYRGLDDESVRERYLGMFMGFGVTPARLELAPASGYPEYLAAYREVDIALDPFPFGGGITTCDALWMGVPVVTCPGETFAGRHSLSHLSVVGLTETIARDLEEYVELAVALAGDLPRLATLRAGLRDRMASSPLCDGKRFAGDFAEVLRRVWRDSREESG